MSYSAQISRTNSSAFVLLLDQSSSMDEPFGGGEELKAGAAANVVNRFLSELVIKCAKSEGIYDYFDIAILGYGRGVSSAFHDGLAATDLVSISQVGDNPLRLESQLTKVPDGTGGLVEVSLDNPVWVEPCADGMTPMCEALDRTREILESWVEQHRDSYPPTVLNITDGEANDGNPLEPARRLRELTTNDGHVLLFNCHLSSKRGPKVQFPDSSVGLIDDFARQLFEMSSELPTRQLEAAHVERFPVNQGSRGFVFNADLVDLIRFIDIGTRVGRLR